MASCQTNPLYPQGDNIESSPAIRHDRPFAPPNFGRLPPAALFSSSTLVGHHTYEQKNGSASIATVAREEHPPKVGGQGIPLTDQSQELPTRQVVIAFIALAICNALSILDQSIVATALPIIRADLNAGNAASWIASASLLTSTAFQPMYGRFSDLLGRKYVLLAALAIFLVGSLGSGLSSSIEMLIAFRAFGGIGNGGVVSLVMIVVSDVVSLRERGKYQGILSASIAASYALGPILGGTFAEKVNWRWCFLIMLPLGGFAFVVVCLVLPLKKVEGDFKKKIAAIDFVGVAMVLAGSILLLLPLNWGGVTFPWSSPKILVSLFLSGYIVIFFCLWEWKMAKLPIVPMYIFANRTVIGSYIATVISGATFFAQLFFVPQFYQIARGFKPILAGTLLIPLLVTQVASSLSSGIMISKTGKYRLNIIGGFILWSIGLGLLSTLNKNSSMIATVAFSLITGFGAGSTYQPSLLAAQAAVEKKDMAVVTAVRNFIRQLGGTIALAYSGAIVDNIFQSTVASAGIPPEVIKSLVEDPTSIQSPAVKNALSSAQSDKVIQSFTMGFRVLFIVSAALTAIAAIASLLLIQQHNLPSKQSGPENTKPKPLQSDIESGVEPDSSQIQGADFEKEVFGSDVESGSDHNEARSIGDGRLCSQSRGNSSNHS